MKIIAHRCDMCCVLPVRTQEHLTVKDLLPSSNLTFRPSPSSHDMHVGVIGMRFAATVSLQSQNYRWSVTHTDAKAAARGESSTSLHSTSGRFSADAQFK